MFWLITSKEEDLKIQRVGIVLFENVEVLDFCGPFEVLSATRLMEEKRREEPSPFEVCLVAEKSDTITTTGGMNVIPDFTFQTCPKLDVLVVPGGWCTRSEINNQVMQQLKDNRAKIVFELQPETWNIVPC